MFMLFRYLRFWFVCLFCAKHHFGSIAMKETESLPYRAFIPMQGDSKQKYQSEMRWVCHPGSSPYLSLAFHPHQPWHWKMFCLSLPVLALPSTEALNEPSVAYNGDDIFYSLHFR